MQRRRSFILSPHHRRVLDAVSRNSMNNFSLGSQIPRFVNNSQHVVYAENYAMIQESLGECLRRLREQQGTSLRALAELTDCSPSFLSQIENGQCSPSISSMERIAKALGLTLWQFFRGVESAKAMIVRAEDRSQLLLEWSRASIEALGNQGSHFQATMVTIKPGGLSGKHATPSINDEFAFLFEGQCVLTLEENDQIVGKGDSVTIPTGVRRRWRNESEQPAQILLISTKPSQ
jgi:transcriptional regulator with XRE-family HTH domain